jgi:hypothetical protein
LSINSRACAPRIASQRVCSGNFERRTRILSVIPSKCTGDRALITCTPHPSKWKLRRHGSFGADV